MEILAVAFTGAVIALAATPLAARFARHAGVMDHPGGRKIHERPTPLFGGLAVAFGFAVAAFIGCLLLDVKCDSTLLLAAMGALIVVAVGLADDVVGLGAAPKMTGQTAAALVALIGIHGTGWLAANPLSAFAHVLWIVGLTNALNFLDNMNGLCAGISLIAGASIAVVGYLDSLPLVQVLGAGLVGAAAGFLPHNIYRARVFLGDAGSLLFGYLLAVISILFVAGGSGEPLRGLVPVLILAYPIFDISFVTLSRIKEGRPVHAPGADHSSHRVAELRAGQSAAVLRIFVLCAIAGAAGVLAYVTSPSPVPTLLAASAAFGFSVLGVNLNFAFSRVAERFVLTLGDSIVAAAAVVFVAWLKFHSGLLGPTMSMPLAAYVGPAVWMAFAWVVLLAIMGGYDLSWDGRLRESFAAVVRMVVIGSAMLGLLTYEFGMPVGPWASMTGLIAAVMIVGLGGLRVVVFLIERRYYLRWGGVRRTVLIGGTDGIPRLRETIEKHLPDRYEIVGTAAWPPDALPETSVFADTSYPGLLLSRLRSRKVEELLCCPDEDFDGLIRLLREDLRRYEISVKVAPDSAPRLRGRTLRKTWNSPLLRLYSDPMRPWEWAAKRVVDIIGAPVLFVITSPFSIFLSLIALATGHVSVVWRVAVPGRGRIGLVLPVHRWISRNGRPSKGWWARRSLTRWLRLPHVMRAKLSFVGPPPVPETLAYDLVAKSPDRARWFEFRPGLVGPAFDPVSAPDDDGAVFDFLSGMGFLRVMLLALKTPLCLFTLPRELRALAIPE
jgi:UDP-GlcNAc:undecaprenyl-phosphate GlcNAc-1-phosphate transferase